MNYKGASNVCKLLKHLSVFQIFDNHKIHKQILDIFEDQKYTYLAYIEMTVILFDPEVVKSIEKALQFYEDLGIKDTVLTKLSCTKSLIELYYQSTDTSMHQKAEEMTHKIIPILEESTAVHNMTILLNFYELARRIAEAKRDIDSTKMYILKFIDCGIKLNIDDSRYVKVFIQLCKILKSKPDEQIVNRYIVNVAELIIKRHPNTTIHCSVLLEVSSLMEKYQKYEFCLNKVTEIEELIVAFYGKQSEMFINHIESHAKVLYFTKQYELAYSKILEAYDINIQLNGTDQNLKTINHLIQIIR